MTSPAAVLCMHGGTASAGLPPATQCIKETVAIQSSLSGQPGKPVASSPERSAGTVEAGAGVGTKRKLDDMAALEEELAPAAAPGTRVPNFVSAGKLL